ncbi:MAG: SDR family oxidoreductase [Pseudomonadota bacterium]|nr:SDR family oxidoreductase [Pseudomonadota bacterium]
MKIVVIGGNGLIGANIVNRLRGDRHDVVAASPRTGVNVITGQGLAEALQGAQVVVDVVNSPSFETPAVQDFFRTACGNLLAAEAAAGVQHHVALSVVGSERLPDNGYFVAKRIQEQLIEAAGRPYTIVRSTQFFEFIASIIDAGTTGDTCRLSPALIQPIAADDVAAALSDVAVAAPRNGTLELAGRDRMPLDELARRFLGAKADARRVVADVHARYFGSELNDRSLVAGNGALIGPTRLLHWLNAAAPRG